MNVNSFGTKLQQIIVMILVVLLVTLIVFYGYLPDSYNYSVGSISESDIYAARTITDNYQTEYDANAARTKVPAIFVRNNEVASDNIARVELFFSRIDDSRDKYSNNGEIDQFSATVAVYTCPLPLAVRVMVWPLMSPPEMVPVISYIATGSTVIWLR